MEGAAPDQLLGHSITNRIAVGPHAGRKVFTLQTLPDCSEPFVASVGKVAGFSARMRVWQPGRTNAGNWNVCAATLQGQRCRKSGCRW